MGYMEREGIETAGQFLLNDLSKLGTTQRSRFYDDPAKSAEFMASFGIEDFDDYEESIFWIALDCAIGQLTMLGIITTKVLAHLMTDGENDCDITLTEAGRKAIEQKSPIKFVGV